MKRILIFMALGPAPAAMAPMILSLATGRSLSQFDVTIGMILLFITLPTTVLAGTLDACLARAFVVTLRAPLIAASGALVAFGLVWMLFGRSCLQADFASFFATASAAYAGVCSLLSNDYGSRKMVHAYGLILE